ncbi:MAG TPA: helix-turn-helix domain-containing protein, partial [Cytophagaceae bacterium]
EVPRYYNGKIGTIKRIEGENIFIEFPGSNEELLLEKEVWRNVRFKYSQESDQIEEEELGTFTQYPVRLAWAITIHKSQGLTFNKAIIDAGESFAPGQVYVALSRMSSLDGLVLHSKIGNDCISSNEGAIAFGERELAMEELLQQLKEAQRKFIHQRLLKAFDWSKLVLELKQYMEEFPVVNIMFQKDAMSVTEKLLQVTAEQEQTSLRFIKQLETLLLNAEEDKYNQLTNRIKAACEYFSEQLDKQQLQLLNEHREKLKLKSKVKKYLKEVDKLQYLFSNKKKILKEVVKLAEGLKEGMEINKLLEEAVVEKKRETEENISINKKDKSKPVKGESHLMSLNLFRQGKSILEIAKERGLAVGTIEGHLISFIPTGELKVEELVAKEKIGIIMNKLEELGEVSSSVIKESLGDGYSYGEIRAVLSHWKTGNSEQQ